MTHHYLVTDNRSRTSAVSLRFCGITSRGTNDVGVSVETRGSESHYYSIRKAVREHTFNNCCLHPAWLLGGCETPAAALKGDSTPPWISNVSLIDQSTSVLYLQAFCDLEEESQTLFHCCVRGHRLYYSLITVINHSLYLEKN